MNLKHLLVLAALAVPVSANADVAAEKRVAVTRVKSSDYGQLYVHTPERHELFRVAQLWRQRPAWWTITVEGHGYVATDEEASISLGHKRAERVRDLLVKFGVDPRFIKAVGHSRAEPGRYVDVTVDACGACKR
jgi:hypothetical protein